MRLALTLVVLAVLAGRPAGDRFVEQRAAAAALNPLSPAFTIALEGGRGSFRVGERIPLVFTYDYVPNRRHLSGEPYTHFATAVLDRQTGWRETHAEFTRSGIYVSGGVCCGVEGGVVAGGSRFGGIGFGADGVPFFLPDLPPLPPPRPAAVTFTSLLNEGIRFDLPGRYRLYMADRHDSVYRRSMGPPPGHPIISNIIEIEIAPRDLAWEADVVRDAIDALDTAADPAIRQEAARTLRFLGSRTAVRAMAARLGRRDHNLERHRERFEFVQGLLSAPDPTFTISRMDAILADPKRGVHWPFIPTLAALSLSRTPGSSFTLEQRRARERHYERRRARSSPERPK